jgi:hypothetical protein
MWLERYDNCNNVAWREITIIIAIIYNSVLKEGVSIEYESGTKTPNISN